MRRRPPDLRCLRPARHPTYRNRTHRCRCCRAAPRSSRGRAENFRPDGPRCPADLQSTPSDRSGAARDPLWTTSRRALSRTHLIPCGMRRLPDQELFMKFGVGQPVRRFEDQTLITGRGRYTDDIALPNMAQAFVLRAPVAHANIERIDAAAARAMPGVLAVLTGDDVAVEQFGDIPCHAPLNNRDGSPRSDTPRPMLAIGKVRHAGQPVALVVAETLPQAQDAAEAIEIEYDSLPAVTDARAALKPGAPQLFDTIPGNLVFDWDNDTSDFAATNAAFARAQHVTTLEMVNNRVVVNAMEPRNAIGDWDAASGRPVLYTGTQGSHFVRDPLAEAVLKIPKEKLRVVTPPNVGGAFGMKAFVYPEQALVVWAASKLKRPVRWQSDRSEGFLSDNQGRDHFTRAELAMDA